MARKVLPALSDIQEAIEGIEQVASGKTFADFEQNWLLRRGIERAIEIISEASRHIPPELQQLRPDIPWHDVATIGNILRHRYHSVSNKIVWDLVQHDLPALKIAIEAIAANVSEE
jgi:uncharacterized protein with HEPN domain